jgi:type VI secretion system secreted protein VgrG
MTLSQENRLISIGTPLGPDILGLMGFEGTEGVSVPFSFELDLVSENGNITFEDIIGQNVTVSIVLADGDSRLFNGMISRFSQVRGAGEITGGGHQLAHYSATMVPWLWLLTRTSNARIFQALSVPEIAEKIFTEKGFSDYKMFLHDTYEKKEYCVQYQETDFNFVSRLLEQDGIYYFFEHEDGKHTMVLADSPEEHKPCPKQETAHCHSGAGAVLEEDVITKIDKMQEIRIGKYTVNDYNFEMPTADLKVEVTSQNPLGPGERELYDYPAEYGIRAQGDRLANIRMQAEEARITTITGSSNCRAFISGYRFILAGHYREDMNNNTYVLVSVNHGAYEAGGGSGGGDAYYTNSFTCIPFDVPYRPPLVTPKPMIGGVQTAIVVGPAGEEIYTDEHGRVKVQFHWDREGKKDEKSSCWIRVSQAWAGAGWGSMHIPRIGQEVIVDFLEGDPDRPIITGRVYHGTNMPPYSLPGEKTKSTIKSDSSLGSGGSNEIRFEDKKDEEEVYLHGQKDWTIVIENNKNQTVGNNESLSVGNNRTKTVGADQSETIGSNKTIQVGTNHTETIGANMSLTVGSNKTETVSINSAETIGAAKELTIGAAYQVTVGAAMNETVGAAKAEEVGASSSESVGGNKAISAGKDVAVQSGGKMAFQAGDDFTVKGKKKGVIDIKDELVIKCGKASITLKKNGDITIEGKKINIKGSGDVIIKGSKIAQN